MHDINLSFPIKEDARILIGNFVVVTLFPRFSLPQFKFHMGQSSLKAIHIFIFYCWYVRWACRIEC